MSTPSGFESRVTAVEAAVRAWGDQRAADERLVTGVERLTDETAGLNSILAQVDEQQQRLSRLGQDLERVEQSVVPREEIEHDKQEAAEEALEFRAKTLRRIYTTTLLLGLFIVLVGGGLYYSQQQRRANSEAVCEARNEQARIIVDILEASLMGVPVDSTNPRILETRNGLARFRALIKDCDQL